MGVAAGGRGVEVRHDHAPPSTYSRPPIVHRGEDPRDRARGGDRVGDRRRRRARRAEHDAAAAAAVDRADPQPPVEARAPALDARVQVVQRRPCAARAAEDAGARQRAAGRRRPRRRCARGALRPADARRAAHARRAPARRGVLGCSSALRTPRACRRVGRGGAPAGRQPRGDDRARRRADERLDVGGSRCRAASSIPARTPCIHASPRTPPPASTRTSGRRSAEGACSSVRVERRSRRHQHVRDNVRASNGRRRPTSSTRRSTIGPRVRALREAMDLSLRDLAERSGVSAPMLSQVERGETSPTLQVASRIAAGLELRLSQLLRLDEAGTVTIVRAAERRRGGGAAGHRFEVLTPPLPGQRAELSRHVLAPGAAHRRRGRPADARARQPRDRARRARHRRAAHRRRRARAARRATASPSTPICPTTSRTPDRSEAVLLAVVSAGLRRAQDHQMPKSLFDKIWEAHEVAAEPDLHRPAPRPRGHQPAGVRRPAAGRPHGPPPRPDARHRRPQRADRRHAGRPRGSRTSSAACRSRRSSATARSSASRSTRSAPSTRASCT